MNRMHRPDPKRPPNMQDKRSVIPIAIADVDPWLFGTREAASALLQLPGLDLINAEPMNSAGNAA
jgi:hypothetical protein